MVLQMNNDHNNNDDDDDDDDKNNDQCKHRRYKEPWAKCLQDM